MPQKENQRCHKGEFDLDLRKLKSIEHQDIFVVENSLRVEKDRNIEQFVSRVQSE